jgi:site-specific DNA-cytosine methylase
LTALALQCLSRLGDQEIAALKCWGAGRTFSYGTACAGTDGPVLVLRCLQKCINAACFPEHRPVGDYFVTEQQFACEIVPWKRRFLKRMFTGEISRLYADAKNLDQESAPDYIVSDDGKKRSKIPECIQGLFAGFPCQDISKYNVHHQQAHGCVAASSRRTGSVFHGLVGCLKKSKEHQETGAFENVKNLAEIPAGKTIHDSNLACCLQMLTDEAQVFAVPVRVDPRCFAGPQSRDRIFMPYVSIKHMEEIGLTKRAAYDGITTLLDRLCDHGRVLLSDLIEDEEHPIVKDKLDRLQALPWKSASNEAAASSKWPKAHVDAFHNKGIPWWERHDFEGKEMQSVFPGLRELSARELDSLAFAKIELPDSHCRLLNVGQGLGRQPLSTEHLKCVTPRMKQLITNQCRCMEGFEAFSFQAIHYGPAHERLREFTSAELMDLAGNAFHGGCFLAVVLATWTTVAVAYFQHRRESCEAIGLCRFIEPGSVIDDSADALDSIWGF